MSENRKIRIYDRALILRGPEEINAFASNPQGFLEEVGALDGLPDYKGIFTDDDKKVENLQEYLSESGGVNKLTLTHKGVPYADHCGWIVQKTLD